MIQANELRIGNWYNEFGIPKQADPNFILSLYQIEIAGKVAIDVSGIPITPEILEVSDFEKIVDGYFKSFYGRYAYIFQTGILPLSIDISGNRLPLENISYLHQLQNLYFALTGVELPINFPTAKQPDKPHPKPQPKQH